MLFVGSTTKQGHHKELWNLSQKLAFNVPQEGEHCFYFPQGHHEQVFCVIIVCFKSVSFKYG